VLQTEYLPDHNRRFTYAAASAEDYHHKKPNRVALDEAFRLETERVIGNDWVVRYENRFLQVNRQGSHWPPAKSKVTACERPDRRLEIRYRGQKVRWRQIAERPTAGRDRRTSPGDHTLRRHTTNGKPPVETALRPNASAGTGAAYAQAAGNCSGDVVHQNNCYPVPVLQAGLRFDPGVQLPFNCESRGPVPSES